MARVLSVDDVPLIKEISKTYGPIELVVHVKEWLKRYRIASSQTVVESSEIVCLVGVD